MADKENKRKCFKCGSSPIEDSVKLFRFSSPGTKNLFRLRFERTKRSKYGSETLHRVKKCIKMLKSTVETCEKVFFLVLVRVDRLDIINHVSVVSRYALSRQNRKPVRCSLRELRVVKLKNDFRGDS
ncbi:hypothetical protein evm_000011 [Chilo suppressalis]|nr:hypothetical protein evm_000011 [Chilo suppressalis]